MIYKPGIMSPSWIPETNVSKGMIFMFRQYIFQAKKTFKYKNNKEFLDTIKPNTLYDKPYLYSYDATLQINKDTEYATKLEALVRAANEELFKDKKNQFYKYYKIDMIGTWEQGYIVLMKPANSKPDMDMIKKKAMKSVVKTVDKGVKNQVKTVKDIITGDYLFDTKNNEE